MPGAVYIFTCRYPLSALCNQRINQLGRFFRREYFLKAVIKIGKIFGFAPPLLSPIVGTENYGKLGQQVLLHAKQGKVLVAQCRRYNIKAMLVMRLILEAIAPINH